MKRIVLAYSGGVDTTCILIYLKEKFGYDVIAYCGDVGQFESQKEKERIKERAIKAGAKKVIFEDLKEEFLKEFCFPALKIGAVYEDKYFLSTALSRPLLAKKLIDVARKFKADAVSHGSTGKGNDQVRFELTFRILAPDLKIIAPLREWEFSSREEEIDYILKHGVSIDVKKSSPYSIDKNIWGVSIECGVIEDETKEVPEEAYILTKGKLPEKERYIEIEYKDGIPYKVNGKKMNPISLIMYLNKIAGSYKIGRTDLIESRVVGIKSREVYEAPAAYILNEGLRELERMTLQKDILHFLPVLRNRYSDLIYEGFYFTDLRKAIEAFFDSISYRLTGKVKFLLRPYSVSISSRSSKYSIYKKELSTYTKESKFDQKWAEGFLKIIGLPWENK
ncbi:MAG: argininosuccinate synthase [Caldiserica bacterium]|nr:MAG: argininosuccinate synthase [Caldisericota bacterium]